MISDFSKIVGYEININTSIVFLCTSNKQAENESKKIVPFIKASKK